MLKKLTETSFTSCFFSDGAVVLCHSEADIHRRVQHLSGSAGCRCAHPVALQVGTLEEYTKSDFYQFLAFVNIYCVFNVMLWTCLVCSNVLVSFVNGFVSGGEVQDKTDTT